MAGVTQSDASLKFYRTMVDFLLRLLAGRSCFNVPFSPFTLPRGVEVVPFASPSPPSPSPPLLPHIRPPRYPPTTPHPQPYPPTPHPHPTTSPSPPPPPVTFSHASTYFPLLPHTHSPLTDVFLQKKASLVPRIWAHFETL